MRARTQYVRLCLPCLLFACLAMNLFSGCSTWKGNIREARQRRTARQKKYPNLPVLLYVPVPKIVDEDGDFEPLIKRFSEDFQEQHVFYLEDLEAFSDISYKGYPDAYELRSNIRVVNYRAPRGGVAIVIIGGFLPPGLGVLWAYPISSGNIEMVIHWSLVDPTGRELARYEKKYDTDVDTLRFSHFSKAINEFVPKFQKAIISRSHAGSKEPAVGGFESVLAVFNIQDLSGEFDSELTEKLTELLSLRLIETAEVKIIPKSQIRNRIQQDKKESYGICYDEECQIEIGKALAAQKSLSVKLMKIGDKCIFSAFLLDLKTETTDKAISLNTGCQSNRLISSMRQLAIGIASLMRQKK